ncbi:MAG: thiamine-monophosphate kinase [Planctomycetes bacterium]|nr:thiamine-monophosphate kinase [Planctomycetota bacterium]MBL7040590.1 thiamine-monophosphate kinase [Pirellulaceae bacterium]
MEIEFLKWLRARLPSCPNLPLGPGDDAAVLELTRGSRCVVTSDMLNEGVDFVSGQCDWRLIGRKALAVNLSDLAAMAARPLAAIVSLALPREDALAAAQQLYEGLIPLAEEFDVAIAGGDTNTWDKGLAISVTAIGEVTGSGPLLRSGARAGDAILVTGEFGGSILGRHFRFTPRVREAMLLHANYQVNAAIDVSDGLSLDLSHITEESGCGAMVQTEAIPIADDAFRLAKEAGPGKTALEHALSDGEDFELILAVPSEDSQRLLADQPLDTPITRIGTFIEEPGLWAASAEGGRQILRPRGYEH